jgi:sugar phosphate isomerase/epimerase
MPSKDTDLIASYWTLAGNLDPGSTATASPWPFADRVAAAADAGYAGFGIRHTDLAAVRSSVGLERMRENLDQGGMRHVELEVLIDWFADGDRRALSDRVRAEMLEAAVVLGARHIKITGDRSAQPWPTGRYVDEFRRLCEEFEPSSTLVVLEPIPMTGIPDLRSALEIVTAADAPNGGLVVDIWHMERAGVSNEEIAATPPDLVKFVELNDAPATSGPATWADTFANRTLCGDGEFDIPGFLAAIDATGYSGPIGVEIIGDEHRRRDLTTAAQAVIASALKYLD